MSNFTGMMFNAFSSHTNARGKEEIPVNVQRNYRNHISKGNYMAAYNTVSRYLPSYKRDELANLVGQFASHPANRKPPPYNASRVNIKRNNNARPYIVKARAGNSKRMIEILQPYRGGKGGVTLGYMNNRLNKNPVKYAMINKTSGNLYAFALLQNNKYEPNSRYLNIVGGLKGYGAKLINKVIENAEKNSKNTINLKAVVTKVSNKKIGGRMHRVPENNRGVMNGLVSLYKGRFKFNLNGYVNHTGLQPMTRYLKNKNVVIAKRKALKKRVITPRVTRSHGP